MQPTSVPQLIIFAEDDRVKLVLANWESRIYTRRGRHHDVANDDVFQWWGVYYYLTWPYSSNPQESIEIIGIQKKFDD